MPLLPILVPLLTCVGCLFAYRHVKIQRWLSVIGASALVASSLYLLASVASDGIQVVQPGDWPAPFGITLVADLLAAVMVTVSSFIGLAVSVYATTGLDQRRQSFGFHPLLHTLLLGVCGAVLSGDLFNLYVWFEVMLITSFVLVSLGGERIQLAGALKYVTLNLVASGLFLAAAGFLYGTVGTLNMADVALCFQTTAAEGVPGIAAGMLLVAFGIKAAIFPFFFWLPASYHTPPVAISAIMAGLLTKVGIYALVRVYSLLFAAEVAYGQPLLLTLAAITMVTGVLGAAAQHEIRRILSFHVISQIGYLLMGLAIFTPLAVTGLVFFLVHNILAKTNLFLIAGLAHRFRGSYELGRLGGLYRSHLWLAILFLISALSLAGLPPFSGFWAKLSLLRAGLEAEHYVVAAVSLGVSLLTLYSMMKIWSEAFWRDPDNSSSTPRIDSSRGSLFGMVAPVVFLSVLTLGLGFAAEPVFVVADNVAEQLLNPSLYIHAVLPGA